MGFIRFGDDIHSILAIFTQLKPIIEISTLAYAKRLGALGKRYAIKHIQNDDLGWAALNKRYQQYKNRIKRNKKYVLTNSFRSAIDWKVKGSFASGDLMITVGIHDGFQPMSGISVGRGKNRKTVNSKPHHPRYIEFLEFGRSGGGQIQPKRPLWKPVLKELTHYIKNDGGAFERILRRTINSMK